jgi:hypothetical protein
MPRVPWIALSTPIPGKTYLALISFLPLKHFRAVPAFIRYSIQTRQQLKSTRGVIGYSLDAEPFARKFWTLSVWEDQESLNDFVRQIPHSQIMQKLIPHMGKTEFAQWSVTHSEIPLDWDAAKSRLKQK